MNSPQFRLNLYDLQKGIQMYVITMLLMSVGGVVMATGFSVFTADWFEILKNAVDVSVISTFSYLIKNLVTNEQGML